MKAKWLLAAMALALAAGLMVALPATPAYADSASWSSAGTFSWTAPAGVTSVTVEVWGGGGGGGGDTGAWLNSDDGAGGGGGGAYAKVNSYTVNPNSSYTVVVGAAGAGGPAGSSGVGGSGGNSYFVNTSTVNANGGGGVNGGDGSSGGAGGTATAGDVKTSGSAGANGGGSGGNGGTAGGPGGGTGGNGANGDADGSGGTPPGGGGGGADAGGGLFGGYKKAGGAGAPGKVLITYKYNTNVSVNCTPTNITYGDTTSCTATVTRAGSTYNVTGSVTWSTADGGTFTTSPCTLGGTGASATCTVTYKPTNVGDGSHGITATYGGDANFNGNSSTAATVSVAKKNLTITSLTANSKTYDGTNAATLGGTAALSGVVSGDTVTLGGTPSATFADKHVGNGKAVNVSGYTLGGASAGNYTLSQPAGLTANISQRALTITAQPDGKVYDATTASAANASVTTGAVQPGDSAPAWTQKYADKNVGSNKAVTPDPLMVNDGNGGNNYSYAYAPANVGSITAKALTLTGLTANSKTYDATTAATLSGTAALGGVIGGDTVTLAGSPSGAFADKNAGTAKPVTVTALTLGGADGGNYTLGQPTVTADINPLAVTLTGARLYDGSTAAAAGNLTITNNLDGADLALAGSGTVASKNVGTYPTIGLGAPLTRVRAATGNTGAAGATSLSVNLGQAPAQGNTLIAVITTSSSSAGAVQGITQDNVTGWTRAAQATDLGVMTEIWYAANVPANAGTAVNISFGSLPFRAAAVVLEYSGVLSANPLDQFAGKPSGSASVNATTGTTAATAQGYEVWVGGIGLANNTATLSGIQNSFVKAGEDVSSDPSPSPSNNVRVYALERIATAAGTASTGGTLSASIHSSGVIATFKAGQPEATLSLTGSAAPNYTLTGLTGSLTINALPVNLAGVKVYDGNATADAGILGVGNKVAGDDVLVASGSGTLGGSTVAAWPITSFGTLALGGTGVGNYTLTGATGSVTIRNAQTFTSTGNGTWPTAGIWDQGTAPLVGDYVVIGGSTTVTLDGNKTVGGLVGTLTINSGGTLAHGGHTLTVTGNLANNGTASGSGKIVLTGGTTAHTLAGNGVYGNLELNDPLGATLTGSPTVNGTLALTNGVISVGSQTLTLGTNAAFTGAFDAGHMIATDGGGALCWQPKNIKVTMTFPLGDLTGTPEYTPATLYFTAGLFDSGAAACVKVTNAALNTATGDYPLYLNRYWTVTTANITGLSCNTTFKYTDADIVYGGQAETSLGLWKVDGTTWAMAGAGTDTANNLLSGNGFTSFSDFTGRSISPLAVKMADFHADMINGRAALSWETVSEQDNAGFNIYRGESEQGPWVQANDSLIPSAAPGSSEGHVYHWTDAAPLSPGAPNGAYWYLLEDVDVNGAAFRHGPVKVGLDAPTAVTLQGFSAQIDWGQLRWLGLLRQLLGK